jgi:Zn-dependent protease with chaperone function
LGHLLLGDWRTGLTACVLVGLLGWATFSVVRARLWGLAALLGFVTLTAYAGSVFSAYSLALREAREARLSTLARATDLAPKPVW